ncbi:MAG: diguanylate cyclase [Campylobacterota bacterium]|nr:diguanylate cyclase [Campylobacterota bacterium]
MKSQNILDIATKDVLTISEDSKISEAVIKMYKNNHRDIVVLSKSSTKYGLLSANDLIKLKTQNIDFEKPIAQIKYSNLLSIPKESSVLDAITEINSDCSCLCVVDDKNSLCGFVSYYDIISSIDPNSMLERRTISEVLLSSHLKTTSQETSLYDVMSMMDNMLYDCVILNDENSNAVGIVTTKDIIKIFGENRDLSKKAKEYMVSPLLTVEYNATILDSLKFIQTKHFKRLIIRGIDGDVIGQITQEELLARVYSRWADVMKDSQEELLEVNKVLKTRATQYELMSVTDRLTGIYNRSKFEIELKSEIQRVERYNVESFSVIFFDIDHFKKINDNYGHLVGDSVLQQVVKIFEIMLRTSDIFARWGGEEFVIIMPLTSIENATLAAEKLCKHIANSFIEGARHITCSFGVSQFLPSDSEQSIMIRADKAMYSAKTQGRNMVVVL